MKKIMFNDKYCLTQAGLSGTKTMTRRVLRDNVPLGNWEETKKHLHYKVGEVIAIAQSYSYIYAEKIADFAKHNYHTPREDAAEKFRKLYETCAGWNNKMFVKADLLIHHIEITDVTVEQLQDISDDDIIREGIGTQAFFHDLNYYYTTTRVINGTRVHWNKVFPTARKAFAALIDKVSGKGTWESNPWVVAYSFELVD